MSDDKSNSPGRPRQFEDKEIIKVINSLPIEYLVFELIGNTKEELEDKIQRQWKIFE